MERSITNKRGVDYYHRHLFLFILKVKRPAPFMCATILEWLAFKTRHPKTNGH